MSPQHGPPAARRRTADRRGVWTGLDQASVMGVELMVGILIWAGVGHLLDRWLGTGPWLLGVGALVGYAGGLYLVWLRAGRMDGGTRPGRTGDQEEGDA